MIGWQECIVALVLLGCVAYLAHRIVKRRGGCDGCPLQNSCSGKSRK